MAKAKNTVWLAPGIPFQLEYAPEALEHVRRIAVEAFYSMPRGGMEVGGILLGRRANGLVEVLNSVPIECEHASGPGFVLSPNDHTRLAALVAGGGRQPGGMELRVVGWFHSHTRSGIFLSAEDLAIHERYFPEPWQVALVVRPEHGAPARAGFFFRGAGGSIHSESTALEFTLQTLAHAAQGAVWGSAAGTAPASEPLPMAALPDPVPVVNTIEGPPRTAGPQSGHPRCRSRSQVPAPVDARARSGCAGRDGRFRFSRRRGQRSAGGYQARKAADARSRATAGRTKSK